MAKKIAYKYVFGYHSVEDIEQEAFILGIEGFKNYDGRRSLYNFLYTHIKNRLGNLKRKDYERIYPPCDKCPFNAYIKKTKECKKYENMQDCELYYNWIQRNNDKKSIMCPVDIAVVGIGQNDQNWMDKEVIKKVEEKLSIKNRKAWLKLLAGDKLKKAEREELTKELEELIDGVWE